MTDGRRLAPRLATSVKITYRGPRHAESSCHSLDLSMRGMFLQLNEPFTPQDWLEISFQVKLSEDRKPVQCFCQVTRVLPVEDAQSYGLMPGIAVEFRQFLQGQTELRSFLAQRLSLAAEELGEPVLGPVPSNVLEPPAPPAVLVTRPAPRPVAAPPAPKKAAPAKPRSTVVANLEPPPIASASRRTAAPSPEHQAATADDGPNKQWTRQDWEGYFASMRRDDREMHSIEDEDSRAAADYRKLALLGLKTALVTVGLFLLIYFLMRVL